jgi:phosphomannomutase
MIKFASSHQCYIVTGSDRLKTIEQIGEELYNKMVLCFQCAGNDVWHQDTRLKTRDVDLPMEMFDCFEDFLQISEFPVKTGNHIEIRPGLANFSIIGRGCTIDEREEYKEWDARHEEREAIVEYINEKFPAFEAQIAGETGVDIIRKGYDKSQIIHTFSPYDEIHFFGDKMVPGGNDYSLMLEVANSGNHAHHVKSWEETWSILVSLS